MNIYYTGNNYVSNNYQALRSKTNDAIFCQDCEILDLDNDNAFSISHAYSGWFSDEFYLNDVYKDELDAWAASRGEVIDWDFLMEDSDYAFIEYNVLYDVGKPIESTIPPLDEIKLNIAENYFASDNVLVANIAKCYKSGCITKEQLLDIINRHEGTES